MEWILNRGQNRSGRREAVEGGLGEWQGEGETSLSGSSPELPCVSPKDVEGRRTGTRVKPWRKRHKEVVSEEVDKSLPWSLNRGSNWTLEVSFLSATAGIPHIVERRLDVYH